MLILQLRALIVDCFREALDRKLFWVMAGISVLIAAAMACVGMDETGIHFLFGKWNFETDVFAPGNPRGPALIGTILTYYIGDFYIGWIGIIIALVATAGIFPTLMERGAIDVVLAKPISRPMIFLGKYLGSMVFVALQATIFILLTFLVVGLRWHCWLWAYLGCIPLIVLLFSYVYAFSALFGVLTRSAMAALLLAMLSWIGIVVPQLAHETLVSLPAVMPNAKVDKNWIRLAKAVKTVVPNTSDITYIAGKLIGAATPTEATDPTDYASSPKVSSSPGTPKSPPPRATPFAPDPKKLKEAEQELSNVDLATSIGSSLIFEAMIVLIAMWKFSRKDF